MIGCTCFSFDGIMYKRYLFPHMLGNEATLISFFFSDYYNLIFILVRIKFTFFSVIPNQTMTASQTWWVTNLGEQDNGIPQYNKSLFWIYSPRMQMLHAQWASLQESRTGTVLTQGVWSRCFSMCGEFSEHHGVAFRRMLCCLFNWAYPADSSVWCQYGFPLSIIPSLTCKLFLNTSVHTLTYDW